MTTRTLFAILASSVSALAQDIPAQPAPLRGPTVTTPDSKPTLVERDLRGRLRRLDRSAEEAALPLLGPAPELKTKVRNQVTNFVQRTRGNATARQKRTLLLSILSQLNPEQRRALIQEALGTPAPESPERSPAPGK